MSHELRTPLNSILILGQQLAENSEGNLQPKQVEFARTIHGAGTDLLNLITDILDLSKIESGTVTIMAEEVVTRRPSSMPWRGRSGTKPRPGASHSKWWWTSTWSRTMVTDAKRLQQVLKNLLSNAFKFTEQGGVRLIDFPARRGLELGSPDARRGPRACVAFEVADTGIGIHPDKQRIIFEAFQQADAGTSRKYGGTGLGLAISRELAALLGGEIQVRSTPGIGSTFTLYLPQRYAGTSTESPRQPEVERRSRIVTGHRSPRCGPANGRSRRSPMTATSLDSRGAVLLIVEDDPHYGRVLVDLARAAGLQGPGRDAREPMRSTLAREYHPTAVSLDVFLPDMLGWSVLNQLKQDPALRHIPVQIVTLDDNRQHGLSRGAFAFVSKPTTTDGIDSALVRIKGFAAPRTKRLLVIEDDLHEQQSIAALIGQR